MYCVEDDVAEAADEVEERAVDEEDEHAVLVLVRSGQEEVELRYHCQQRQGRLICYGQGCSAGREGKRRGRP